MATINATKVAMWFTKHHYDDPRNTKRGNMKLQKLLYFSQLVHLAKYREPLFNEKVLAFENGAVVEKVRHQYYYNHSNFINDAICFNPEFSKEELSTLNIVEEIFGGLNPEELSDLCHLHKSWMDSFELSKMGTYYEKFLSEITVKQMLENEVGEIEEMIAAYEAGKELSAWRTINGRKFYFNPERLVLTEDVIAVLESFDGPDSSYTVYKDESMRLIIY